jgi:hypothetical protein
MKAEYNAGTFVAQDGRSYPVQMTSDGLLKVYSGGNVASGATDSGNPVKIGGVYNTTQPTLTNGQRGDVQLDTRGNAKVTIFGPDSVTSVGVTANSADAVASPNGLRTSSFPFLYNGATHDRARNNNDITVFTSTARTATPTAFTGTNYNARGLHLVIDVTAATSTPSTVFTILGVDAISGGTYTILASAAIVGVGRTVLRVYPGLTAAANLVASDILPRSWSVTAAHGNANSQTYSVGASLIL